jgi:multiple sugar transport system substrate-binding protein
VDSTAGATWMGSEAPLTDISRDKFVAFETAVRMVPQFDPDNPKMISQGPSVCVFNHGDPQEVLASWLFTQYLLSNDVQIAYASTEGYVPVTTCAQHAPEYVDYLARIGEDNKEHYAVKIEASRLLTDNVASTFVTPAFNGSASLRDAAGQLIENTVKSVRRKQTVDDAYFEKLYDDMVSLYHLNLDGTGASASSRQELGPLPHTSVVLLTSLVCAWVLIGAYVVIRELRKKSKNRKG